MQKREAYLAGSWYPKTKNDCVSVIKEYESRAKLLSDKNLFYKIGIVPHAGWTFSGALAHSVIYNISRNTSPDIIFLAGGHLSPNDCVYIMDDCEVETPFGNMRCISDYNNDLTNNLKFKIERGDSYEPDNTTELQLPFLKYYFPTAKIVICRIPPNDDALTLAANLKKIIESKKINYIFIGSTDLTHYGFRFNFTPEGRGAAAVDWVKNQNDKSIINAALKIDAVETLKLANAKHNSCCGGSISAAVELARLSGRQAGALVDYYTSADVLNEKNSTDFVGYAGIVY